MLRKLGGLKKDQTAASFLREAFVVLLKMKNDVLPSLPSQLYIFGNNELHMPNSDVYMDNNKVVSFDPKIFYELGDGGFAFPSQSFINHQQGPSSSMAIQRLDYPSSGANYQNYMPKSCFGNISQQSSVLLSKKQLTLPHVEAGFQGIPNSRKRPFEGNDLCLPEKGSTDLIGKANNAALNECKKRTKEAMCFEQKWHHQVKDQPIHIQNYRLHVPVRRSHKLSDKITALQKLVSPYGKTDTASVLQEASVYIKFLQEKIRTMFEMMSASHVNISHLSQQKIEEKQGDLRSRGLSVVPVSFTGKLTREDGVDHHHAVVSRQTIMPKYYF